MNNKLSSISRIVIALASAALVAVFFLPAWRIDLFAPQYPEGLMMNIWINNISGDVDIINGLNHYIGMKHITVGMFPEFSYLPYVVVFFILLGVIVAITGNRKFLFLYILLTLVGGVLAMYDFYKWGYDYGHNLDPKAAIQVPGLSYQPPLFGHKRLLNFDAYSFPDIGGWIVIGVAFLLILIWFVEWYRAGKKKNVGYKYTRAAVSIICLTSLFSCNTKPEPFVIGKDACSFCKMTITDTRFGAELLTKKGKIYKFDDMHCMAAFIKSATLAQKDIAQTVAVNFNKPNTFIDVTKASFVIDPETQSPMGSNALGFESKEAATEFGKNKQIEITDWSSLLTKLTQ